MTERRKLDLQINNPTLIELLYDEPITGESRHGKYYLYSVRSEGDEFSFFAPEEVHNELQHLNRGDTALITKLAAQRGNKLVTKYAVETKSSSKGSGQNNGASIQKATEEKIKNPIPNADHYFQVMLQSYKDALEIQDELNGMVDVTRIAITLFIARSKLPLNGNNR